MINIIIWQEADTGEYKVPTPDSSETGAYYTHDLDDAIATFDNMWVEFENVVQCKIKLCDEHPMFLSDYDDKWVG